MFHSPLLTPAAGAAAAVWRLTKLLLLLSAWGIAGGWGSACWLLRFETAMIGEIKLR
jgi:hypothetical protein